MAESEPKTQSTRACSRCQGKAIYWQTAIVPGDAMAPQGSNRAFAHSQPAWICLACGFLEPYERRMRSPRDDDHPIWRP